MYGLQGRLSVCASNNPPVLKDTAQTLKGISPGGEQCSIIKIAHLAPAEAMRETIKYLNSKYGSMSGYMTHVGFGPESQHTLGRLLTKEG